MYVRQTQSWSGCALTPGRSSGNGFRSLRRQSENAELSQLGLSSHCCLVVTTMSGLTQDFSQVAPPFPFKKVRGQSISIQINIILNLFILWFIHIFDHLYYLSTFQTWEAEALAGFLAGCGPEFDEISPRLSMPWLLRMRSPLQGPSFLRLSAAQWVATIVYIDSGKQLAILWLRADGEHQTSQKMFPSLGSQLSKWESFYIELYTMNYIWL